MLLPRVVQEGSITFFEARLENFSLERLGLRDYYRPESLSVEIIAAIEASYRVVD